MDLLTGDDADRLSRLLRVLGKHPHVAYALSQRLKVFGPWERPEPGVDDETVVERNDSVDDLCAYIEVEGPGRWTWNLVATRSGGSIAERGGFPTLAGAMIDCDRYLVREGYIVVPSVVEEVMRDPEVQVGPPGA